MGDSLVGTRRPSSERVYEQLKAEERLFCERHPASGLFNERALRHLPRGVPLHWMAQWPSAYPVQVIGASGAEVVDADGNRYIDFCLGDSAAMFGHGLIDVADAARERLATGATFMLPTSDAADVAEDLAERFGLPHWQFATSASDANRFAIRLARIATGRPKVLVFNGKYHGSIDETHVTLVDGRSAPQPGIPPLGVELDRTTAIIEFNDVDAIARALAAGDVACVLTEPAMTNCSMIFPQPGFHEALRDLTRAAGTLLIIDETHTFCAGSGGMTRTHGLEPDLLTLGKSIGAGLPLAVYGMTESVAETLREYTTQSGRAINHFGFGGTLVGDALATRIALVVLQAHATGANFDRMIGAAGRLQTALSVVLAERHTGWSVTRLGCRVEIVLAPDLPLNATAARATRAPDVEAAIRLGLINRGFLLTPFHLMALVCPQVTDSQIEGFTTAVGEVLDQLLDPSHT